MCSAATAVTVEDTPGSYRRTRASQGGRDTARLMCQPALLPTYCMRACCLACSRFEQSCIVHGMEQTTPCMLPPRQDICKLLRESLRVLQ